MRIAIILCVTFAIAIPAVAQTSEFTGSSERLVPIPDAYNNPLPGPGTYALPFVPLVSTPIVSLPTPSLRVGASNATDGNVAGAQTLTASSERQAAESPWIEPRISGDARISADVYPRPSGRAKSR